MKATLEQIINKNASEPNTYDGVFELTETSALREELACPPKKLPIASRFRPICLQFSYGTKKKGILVFYMYRQSVLELVLRLITKLDPQSLCDVIEACNNAIRKNVSKAPKK